MQGLFSAVLIGVLLFVAAKDVSVLDGIEKRQQHDAIMQRLAR